MHTMLYCYTLWKCRSTSPTVWHNSHLTCHGFHAVEMSDCRKLGYNPRFQTAAGVCRCLAGDGISAACFIRYSNTFLAKVNDVRLAMSMFHIKRSMPSSKMRYLWNQSTKTYWSVKQWTPPVISQECQMFSHGIIFPCSMLASYGTTGFKIVLHVRFRLSVLMRINAKHQGTVSGKNRKSRKGSWLVSNREYFQPLSGKVFRTYLTQT